MERTTAKSASAAKAYGLVEALQARFVRKLEAFSQTMGCDRKFEPIEWFREQGEYGGGVRLVATDEQNFNRAMATAAKISATRPLFSSFV